MLVDAILLIFCVLAFFRGWKKGLLWAVFSLIAIVAGIIISLKLSHQLSEFLFEKNILSGQYTFLLSFVLLFLGSLLLFRMLIKICENVLDTFFLGWLNRLLGGILYSFFVVFILSTFYWLAGNGHLLKPDFKRESHSYRFVAPIAPQTIEITTKYLPLFKSLYNDIETYYHKTKVEKH